VTAASERLDWDTQLRSLLSRVKESESVALFCHQNADPDATCSAFALQGLLQKLAPATLTKIVCPEGVSASTKQLLENLGITVPDGRLPAKVDLAILVDTNTLDQLGQTGEKLIQMETPIVVVDHHHPHPDTMKVASQLVVDESAAAAAQIVYWLWQASKTELGAQEARTLLAAIFIETKHFLLATESTFEIAAGLVKAGADPRHLSELMSNPVSRSERVARLKAAGRSQIALLGEWIVATSELGSYQSSAARALLAIGAHVAFVAGESKEKIRVNMRATEGFYSKTGIHLARDVSIPIGKKLSGVGGGHATAAGLSVPGQVQDVLKICVDILRESLGPSRPNITGEPISIKKE
jgi:bifunctional oligoribonuclease and PAP phosphatase NrnA